MHFREGRHFFETCLGCGQGEPFGNQFVRRILRQDSLLLQTGH